MLNECVAKGGNIGIIAKQYRNLASIIYHLAFSHMGFFTIGTLHKSAIVKLYEKLIFPKSIDYKLKNC